MTIRNLAICGVALAAIWFCSSYRGASPSVALAADQAAVTFSGGHEIARNDFGRPIPLISAALGVKPEVFREAFSGVTPARGRGPSGDEARKNKGALMRVLAPHNVSNERLDEVSNYYRFRPQNGELWPTKEAKGYAVIEDGKIKKIVVTEPGSGYCSIPEVKVEGFDDAALKVKLGFSKDFNKNGRIESIEVEKPEIKAESKTDSK